MAAGGLQAQPDVTLYGAGCQLKRMPQAGQGIVLGLVLVAHRDRGAWGGRVVQGDVVEPSGSDAQAYRLSAGGQSQPNPVGRIAVTLAENTLVSGVVLGLSGA